MTLSDDEDASLAEFLESEVLSEASDADVDTQKEKKFEEKEEPKRKKLRVEEGSSSASGADPARIESGILSKIPPELFPQILKFLSSEDLVSCSLACRFLNYAASDESLWRRLYCMRWGLLPPNKSLRVCAWKKLYIQRDEEDMVELVRNCSAEFKEYYIQMQVAKRSQAPLPSQVKDDRIILDKTVGDQVSIWKSSRGLTDSMITGHACSGEMCTYHQIGNVFVCEKTGYVHVCDDTCREVILDPNDLLMVCKISGRCFENLMEQAEMESDSGHSLNGDVGFSKLCEDIHAWMESCFWKVIRTMRRHAYSALECPTLEQGGVADEAEPFMGSGRFAQAYTLGYNCDDEKELEAALRFCPV